MAGTLFGLGLSQQVDAAGNPLAGCLLYLYDANGTTPQSSYAEFALSTLQTFPIVADSAGRLPQIWVADGSYRARLTTSAGVAVFDEASVTAIGASVTSGGSGGGGSSVDATTIFQTGDTLWVPYSGTRTGWVRHNGRTIGSGSSAGTERANADVQDLFEYLWNTHSNTLCAVSGGRGSTATADFNANKTIATLNMKDRVAFGLDDMGDTAAGIISGGTTAGATGGGYLPSYHEASWTPALAFGGSATGITYSTQVGRYIRIDDMITAWGTLVVTDNGSASGTATITGLPYAASTISGLSVTGSLAGFSVNSSNDGFAVRIESNTSTIALYQDGGGSVLTNTEIDNTCSLYFTVTYRTDDTTAGTTGTNPVLYTLGTWFVKL